LDLELDQCPTCKGIWFDKNELEQLVDSAASKISVPPEAEPSMRVCPLCHKKMLVFHYPRTLVSVDFCRSCKGLWLDQGELNQIRAVRDRLEKGGQLDDKSGISLGRFIKVALASFKK